MENSEQIVDFSYITELSNGKPEFMNQVLTIFMENTPPGLVELENLIINTRKWYEISKQAHFLKSSVGIVKIHGMHERLQQIESIAKTKPDKLKVNQLLDEILDTFSRAEVIIRAKMKNTVA